MPKWKMLPGKYKVLGSGLTLKNIFFIRPIVKTDFTLQSRSVPSKEDYAAFFLPVNKGLGTGRLHSSSLTHSSWLHPHSNKWP